MDKQGVSNNDKGSKFIMFIEIDKTNGEFNLSFPHDGRVLRLNEREAEFLIDAIGRHLHDWKGF